jgi:hypothetical protein
MYHPKNNVHNQDGNHDDNKVRITIFFFELTDNDGQNFLAGIVVLVVQCERFLFFFMCHLFIIATLAVTMKRFSKSMN